MISNIIRIGKTLRCNYREIIFVFLAFALMVMAANFSVGRIFRSRLLDRAEEMIYAAEANVRAGLSEAEAILLNSYHIVQGILEQNASREEILDYLGSTTAWMRQLDQGLLGFHGIYGYINGEFYDSIGLNPGSDFIPQTRPWYQTAVRSGAAVGYTAPYRDLRTGETKVSAVRNIDEKDGATVGILTVDIDITWLVDYVQSLAGGSGGYGILITQNMTIMAHPDSAYMGLQLQDLDNSYEEIARILRSGGEVSALRIRDTGGNSAIVFFTRIFNGWYVGIITPYYRFYRDLYISAVILVALGIILSLALCYLLLRLSSAKMRADEESKSKSSFLASMSHEIRTPMNAIIGMADLLLRRDLPQEARGDVEDIKQAGANLLSIINDILDFSKIEAGRLEIIPAPYLFSSIISDTDNIIRMRLTDKPIRFFTNIDGHIPNSLIGDEVRMRQILLNLLSNAVKYSEKGHIGLTVTLENRSDNQVSHNKTALLKITVSDTGRGIKPEDQAKLFGEFSQVDTGKNRGIEGTGLGLAITKRLCLAMGGDISVESEYGKGSAFTAIIPQGIESEAPFAAVEEPEQKKVLMYERRAVCAKSVSWSLEKMGVPHTVVTNHGDFTNALLMAEWFYVFSGYGLYEEIRPALEKTSVPGKRKPLLALMVEWGTETSVPGAHFLLLPVLSLSIANVLNGREDVKGYAKRGDSSGAIRFSLKRARLLVVDDIATNLKVAEGLLAPYQAAVDTCLSGREAIELVKKRDYDIVFMDHMMPDMDGIEAVKKLRSLGYKGVIIALTANAVSGMMEMFINEGFNDFLAKPIDITKLDAILDRWIIKEKREEREEKKELGIRNEEFEIPGVDVRHGIAMTGGTVELYRKVLTFFYKDAEERLPLLKTAPNAGGLPEFVTHVHALKSASASAGAAEVSAMAVKLEAAGKAGDLAFIGKELPAFSAELAELAGNIRAFLDNASPPDGGEPALAHYGMPLDLLRELGAALESQKADEIDRVLNDLNQKTIDSKFKEILEKISDSVLMAEFGDAKKIIDGLF